MTGKATLHKFSSIFIGIITAGILLSISLGLQLALGQTPSALLKYPISLGLMLEFCIGLPLLFLIFKKTAILQWLSSAIAAITAISLFSICVIFMAVIPQEANINSSTESLLALNQIVHTWLFHLSAAFLVTTLGFATLRRAIPFRTKNLPFLFNHLGLWIALTAGLVGAADKQELMMQVFKNQVVWYAQSADGKTVELPLAIKLNQFVMKNHPPKIALVNGLGIPYKTNGDQLTELKPNTPLQIGNYTLSVTHLYNDGILANNRVSNQPDSLGAAPYAYLSAITSSKETPFGWLTPGSYARERKVIQLAHDTLLCILPLEPAYFGSEITLYTQSENRGAPKTISVNHPIDAEGWKIYQYSYDSQFGKDSPYSVFLLVRDPWLPIVYAGICLMMMGAILLIFTKVGQPKNREELI